MPNPVDDVADDVAAAISSLREEPVEEKTEAPVEAQEAEPEKPAVKEDATGRLHGEKGKFVSKEPKEEKVETEPIKEVQEPLQAKEVPAPAAPPTAPALSPPRTWSVAAKAAWDKLPPEVKADAIRREEEVTKGFEKYQGYRELDPFVERCRQSGQSPGKVIANYMGIDDLIHRDVIGGIDQIATNVGLNNVTKAQVFGRLAAHYSGGQAPMSPQTGAANGADPSNGLDPALQQVMAQYLNPVLQETQTLKQQIEQQQRYFQQQREQAASSVVEQFRSDPKNRYFDNVEDKIADLLNVIPKSGDLRRDLEEAYQMACGMDPEIRRILAREEFEAEHGARVTREKAEADKKRSAARSVTGSPSTDAKPANPQRNGASYDDDLHADVVAAMRQVSARA